MSFPEDMDDQLRMRQMARRREELQRKLQEKQLQEKQLQEKQLQEKQLQEKQLQEKQLQEEMKKRKRKAISVDLTRANAAGDATTSDHGRSRSGGVPPAKSGKSKMVVLSQDPQIMQTNAEKAKRKRQMTALVQQRALHAAAARPARPPSAVAAMEATKTMSMKDIIQGRMTVRYPNQGVVDVTAATPPAPPHQPGRAMAHPRQAATGAPSTTAPAPAPANNNTAHHKVARVKLDEHEALERAVLGARLFRSEDDDEASKEMMENASLGGNMLPLHFASSSKYTDAFMPLLLDEGRASIRKEAMEAYIGSSRSGQPGVLKVRISDFTSHPQDELLLVVIDIDASSHEFMDAKLLAEGAVVILAPGSGEENMQWFLGYAQTRDKEAQALDTRSERTATASSSARTSSSSVAPPVVAGVIHQLNMSTARATVRVLARFVENDTDESLSARTVISRLMAMQKACTVRCVCCSHMVSLKREFSALRSVQKIALNLPELLRPKRLTYHDGNVPHLPAASCFSPTFATHLHDAFNTKQRQAIHFAASHMHSVASSVAAAGVASSSAPSLASRFTLVQGPPGTGKTHAIWGMLNVIHLLCYHRYYEKMLGEYESIVQGFDAFNAHSRQLNPAALKPRILICAPSNAAVDEIMFRILKHKFIDGNGRPYTPGIVRVGSSSRAAAKTTEEEEMLSFVSVDSQVKKLLQVSRAELEKSAEGYRARMHAAAVHLDHLVRTMRARRGSGEDMSSEKRSLVEVFENLNRDTLELEKTDLLIAHRRFQRRKDVRLVENLIIQSAELVFTTLSSASRNVLTRSDAPFATILIDEAAQATEVACLQALQYNPQHVVLIGDPRQLPATVMSQKAERLGFDRSLFERLQEFGSGAIRLTTQYRMHPDIREFPSKHFYEDSLVDAAGICALPPEWYHDDVFMRPFVFFDVAGDETRSYKLGTGTSISNWREAVLVVALVARLYRLSCAITMQTSPRMTSATSLFPGVAVVTPYRDQVGVIRRAIDETQALTAVAGTIRVSTIDGFQGQESDVIIMSCVRSRAQGLSTTGFVADIRRMNVAITRARRSLWIVGNAVALESTEGHWKKLIGHAREHGRLLKKVSVSELDAE